MNVLIVGANGQLGQELAKLYTTAIKTDQQELDITDAEAVASFDWNKVGCILNAAAFTKVDAVEDPANMPLAWKVNVQGVANLAAAARSHELPLVHVSTDYIFDGAKEGAYLETDAINPQGNYGRSKAGGDLAASSANKHYIVRTSWVIGDGPNFVRTMLKLGEEKNEVSVVNDQRGHPTFAKDLALAIKHLLDTSSPFGTYNFSNDGPAVSWYEFTQAIFKQADVDCEVKPTSTKDFAQGKQWFAPRPANSELNLDKIKATGLKIRNWQKALQEYLIRESNR